MTRVPPLQLVLGVVLTLTFFILNLAVFAMGL